MKKGLSLLTAGLILCSCSNGLVDKKIKEVYKDVSYEYYYTTQKATNGVIIVHVYYENGKGVIFYYYEKEDRLELKNYIN